MKHPVIVPAEDIMPASFAYGFAASILVGLALWRGAYLILFG